MIRHARQCRTHLRVRSLGLLGSGVTASCVGGSVQVGQPLLRSLYFVRELLTLLTMRSHLLLQHRRLVPQRVVL